MPINDQVKPEHGGVWDRDGQPVKEDGGANTPHSDARAH